MGAIDPAAYAEWERQVAEANAPAAAPAKPLPVVVPPAALLGPFPKVARFGRVAIDLSGGPPPLKYASPALLPPPRRLQDRGNYLVRRVTIWQRQVVSRCSRMDFFGHASQVGTDRHPWAYAIPAPLKFEVARLRLLYEPDPTLGVVVRATQVLALRRAGRACLINRDTSRVEWDGLLALLPFTFDRPLYLPTQSMIPVFELEHNVAFDGSVVACLDGWAGIAPP